MPLDPELVTLATFLYLAHRAGFSVQDARLNETFRTIDSEGATEALGAQLVEILHAQLPETSPDAVIGLLNGLLGGALRADFAKAETREQHVAAVRREVFGRSTPWLAWLVASNAEGAFYRQCVLVEGFGEVVQVMDPNPFNDIDEARSYPIDEFMGLWEVAGARSAGLSSN